MSPIDQVEAAAYAQVRVGNTWTQNAEAAMAKFAKSGEPFQCADVRHYLAGEGVEEPSSPNAWGSLFNVWARKGLIEIVAFTASRNNRSNGSRVFEWIGTEKIREQ